MRGVSFSVCVVFLYCIVLLFPVCFSIIRLYPFQIMIFHSKFCLFYFRNCMNYLMNDWWRLHSHHTFILHVSFHLTMVSTQYSASLNRHDLYSESIAVCCEIFYNEILCGSWAVLAFLDPKTNLCRYMKWTLSFEFEYVDRNIIDSIDLFFNNKTAFRTGCL